MMVVHVDDTSMPQFPPGWEALDEDGESCFFYDDKVVWILREV